MDHSIHDFTTNVCPSRQYCFLPCEPACVIMAKCASGASTVVGSTTEAVLKTCQVLFFLSVNILCRHGNFTGVYLRSNEFVDGCDPSKDCRSRDVDPRHRTYVNLRCSVTNNTNSY